jgi:glycosyltransferase involved in cell wall biosynthesis
MNKPVKVLVVAPTPPTYLGLPIMIEAIVRSHMPGVELRHVRLAFSANESQVGKLRLGKMLRVIPVVLQVLWQRLLHGPQILYFAPAGATTAGMLRDVAIFGTTRFLFTKTIVHFHAGGHAEFYRTLPKWKQWLFRKAYFHADAAIRLTENTPEDGKGLLAQSEYIVPNGIADLGAELEFPRRAPAISASRPLRILFVALLCETKGLMVLIEAAGKLAARGVPFRLDLMGRFQHEEFAARVKARIAELGIGAQVNFLGVLMGDEKLAAFREADVLCHPTYHDTFGLVILEGMSCGMPVVATRYCSIPLIVDDGETGLLVPPRDPDGLAEALAELADNPELIRQMGIAGREKFLREFTLQRHVEQMRQVFLAVGGQASEARELETYEELTPVSV